MYSVVAELTFSFCHCTYRPLALTRRYTAREHLSAPVKFLGGFHVELPGFVNAVSRFLRSKSTITRSSLLAVLPKWSRPTRRRRRRRCCCFRVWCCLQRCRGEMKIDKVGLAPVQIPTYSYIRGTHDTLFVVHSRAHDIKDTLIINMCITSTATLTLHLLA